jgi:hypothetical protein
VVGSCRDVLAIRFECCAWQRANSIVSACVDTQSMGHAQQTQDASQNCAGRIVDLFARPSWPDPRHVEDDLTDMISGLECPPLITSGRRRTGPAVQAALDSGPFRNASSVGLARLPRLHAQPDLDITLPRKSGWRKWS